MSGGGLTDSQKKRVGAYFARNYDQGKLVEIPKKDEDSWHEWMEKKLRSLNIVSSTAKLGMAAQEEEVVVIHLF